jgi:hypothetical protein
MALPVESLRAGLLAAESQGAESTALLWMAPPLMALMPMAP